MKKRLREVVNSGPSFSASSQFRDEASDEKDPDAVATLRWNRMRRICEIIQQYSIKAV